MQRIMSFLVGADGTLLASCPPGDRDNVATIGWLLIGVWIWQVIVLSVALHVGLAPDGAIRPAYVALAVLVATLVRSCSIPTSCAPPGCPPARSSWPAADCSCPSPGGRGSRMRSS